MYIPILFPYILYFPYIKIQQKNNIYYKIDIDIKYILQKIKL
jgi:hypothetical protein